MSRFNARDLTAFPRRAYNGDECENKEVMYLVAVPTIRLSGTFVDLRPLTEDDLDARLEMVNDRAVQKLYIGAPADQNTRFDMENWFHALKEDPFSEQWAIETKDGKYIGDIDFHSINVIKGEAWISPMIGDLTFIESPAYRRDAIELITQHSFDEHHIERLQIDIPSTDQQGIAILHELGFEIVEETEFDFIHDVKTVTLAVTPVTFVRS